MMACQLLRNKGFLYDSAFRMKLYARLQFLNVKRKGDGSVHSDYRYSVYIIISIRCENVI